MVTNVQITNEIIRQEWLVGVEFGGEWIVLKIPHSSLLDRAEKTLHDVLTNLQSVLDTEHGGYKLTNEDKNMITSLLVWGYVNPYAKTNL